MTQVGILDIYTHTYIYSMGARGCVVVKAFCYKMEGRGFDTR
jgi:hypothetical protein